MRDYSISRFRELWLHLKGMAMLTLSIVAFLAILAVITVLIKLVTG